MKNLRLTLVGIGENSPLYGDIVSSLPDEYNRDDLFAFPGFCDVHVHFREPGFSYKETIRSGSLSALHGGFTTVCTMPNLDPVPDCLENLTPQLDLIRDTAQVNVVPFGSITVGERGEKLSDMESLAPYVAGFSDDGHGVNDSGLMREAMLRAKKLGKVISAHCEDLSLTRGGYIHDGEYARKHGITGIPSESEWRPIERDLRLAEETGCAYHVCHISAKESVSLIREAKKSGVDVTCETAPHYLALDERVLRDEGRYKMNPPLRSRADREALLEGIADGTVDMIATDHAPHSVGEKSRGLKGSLFGVVGLETAFAVCWTYLARRGVITLGRLIELMSSAPRERFSLPASGWSVWDLSKEFTANPGEFHTLGRAMPFEGDELFGKLKYIRV